MKKILSAAVLAATLPQAASALPLVDFYAGGYYWDQTISGDVSGSADIEDNLNLDAGGQNVLYFAFEHPIPVIPNVKFKSTEMSSDGSGSVTNLSVGGNTVNGAVDSELDFSHNDYTLYWSLPIPIVTIDFGLTLRQFDGSITSVSSGAQISEDLDFIVPMGYLKAGIDIPLTGLSFGGDINVISIGDTGITDYDLNMTYVLPLIPLLDVGISAGYRSFDLELDEDDFGDLSAEATVAGPYLGLSLHL
ncbi:MAG: TIGR04219 family outer membrane beta-barrel protein [Bermanella sp.]